MALLPELPRSARCGRDYEFFLQQRAEDEAWASDVIGALPKLCAGLGVSTLVGAAGAAADSEFADWSRQLGLSGAAGAAPRKREQLVRMPAAMSDKIKAHQRSALRFMWRRIWTPGEGGCVLAHGMGLGKTLDAVVLIEAFVRTYREHGLAAKVVYVLKQSVVGALLMEMRAFPDVFAFVTPGDKSKVAADRIAVYNFNEALRMVDSTAPFWLQHPVYEHTIRRWHASGGVLLLLETWGGVRALNALAHAHGDAPGGAGAGADAFERMSRLFPVHRSVRFCQRPGDNARKHHAVVAKVGHTNEHNAANTKYFEMTLRDAVHKQTVFDLRVLQSTIALIPPGGVSAGECIEFEIVGGGDSNGLHSTLSQPSSKKPNTQVWVEACAEAGAAGEFQPALLVVDEAHGLYAKDLKVGRGLRSRESGEGQREGARVLFFETRQRVMMTGTPLLNSATDLWDLMHVVRGRTGLPPAHEGTTDKLPAMLRERKDFARLLSLLDTADLKRAAADCLQHYFVRGFMDIQSQEQLLSNELPPRREYAVFVRMNDEQTSLLRVLAQQPPRGGLNDAAMNRTIAMHPKAFRGLAAAPARGRGRGGASAPPPVASSARGRGRRGASAPPPVASSARGRARGGASAPPPVASSARGRGRGRGRGGPQLVAGGAGADGDDSGDSADEDENDSEQDEDDGDMDILDNLLCADSPKMLVAQRLIHACLSVGERVVVISARLLPLRMLARDLSSFAPPGTAWAPGVNYCVVDGSLQDDRRSTVFELVSRLDTSVRVLFLSKGIGNAGITLNAFSRMIIFEMDFTPSIDAQCMGRIYRYGQPRPVVFYRLVAADTLEEAILRLQAAKSRVFAEVLTSTVTSDAAARPDVAINTKPPVLTHARAAAAVVARACDDVHPVFDDAVLQRLMEPGAGGAAQCVQRVEQPGPAPASVPAAPSGSAALRASSAAWQLAAAAAKLGRAHRRQPAAQRTLRWRCDVCCAPMQHALKPDYELEAAELEDYAAKKRRARIKPRARQHRTKFLEELLGCPCCRSVFRLSHLSVLAFRHLQHASPVERAPVGAMLGALASDGAAPASAALGTPFRCCHEGCARIVRVRAAAPADALQCDHGIATAAHAHRLLLCSTCQAHTLALACTAPDMLRCVGCGDALLPAG